MSISAHKLEFSYASSVNDLVIDIDHWSVAESEKLFLYGPSGSGKSTLLNLISGVLPTKKGEINVLGESLHDMNTKQRDRFRANNIGYVFQQFNLIPYLSAIENIALANHFANKKNKSPLRSQIHTLLDRLALPEKNWLKPISQLSVGQQQRIAIARALINQPKLFIADEPTSSLDQQNSELFMSLLMTLCDEYNMTLLFVSHDNSLSHYFDKSQELPLINHTTNAQLCF
jgi:putative ABC transport system ATP-binding protein